MSIKDLKATTLATISQRMEKERERESKAVGEEEMDLSVEGDEECNSDEFDRNADFEYNGMIPSPPTDRSDGDSDDGSEYLPDRDYLLNQSGPSTSRRMTSRNGKEELRESEKELCGEGDNVKDKSDNETSEKQNNECPVCRRVYANPWNLIRHQRSHGHQPSDRLTNSDKIEDKLPVKPSKKITQLPIKSSKKKLKSWHCHDCNKEFRRIGGLKSHFRTQHPYEHIDDLMQYTKLLSKMEADHPSKNQPKENVRPLRSNTKKRRWPAKMISSSDDDQDDAKQKKKPEQLFVTNINMPSSDDDIDDAERKKEPDQSFSCNIKEKKSGFTAPKYDKGDNVTVKTEPHPPSPEDVTKSFGYDQLDNHTLTLNETIKQEIMSENGDKAQIKVEQDDGSLNPVATKIILQFFPSKVRKVGKRYFCYECERHFGDMQYLKKHFLGIHTDKRPYICNICNRGFVEQYRLKRHILSAHGDVKDRLNCLKCETSYTIRESLIRHIRKIHPKWKTWRTDMEEQLQNHVEKLRSTKDNIVQKDDRKDNDVKEEKDNMGNEPVASDVIIQRRIVDKSENGMMPNILPYMKKMQKKTKTCINKDVIRLKVGGENQKVLLEINRKLLFHFLEPEIINSVSKRKITKVPRVRKMTKANNKIVSKYRKTIKNNNYTAAATTIATAFVDELLGTKPKEESKEAVYINPAETNHSIFKVRKRKYKSKISNKIIEKSSTTPSVSIVEEHCIVPRKYNYKGTGDGDNSNIDRTFNCTICKMQFTNPKSRNKHITTNHPDQLFKCKQCNRMFKFATSLRMHEKTHSGEKPYECHICHVKFSLPAVLHNHLRVHSCPFKCTQCSSSFSHRNLLKKHVSRFHSLDDVRPSLSVAINTTAD